MAHLWWALGTVGPLARSVLDSALVYDVIRGSLPTPTGTARAETRSFVEAARPRARAAAHRLVDQPGHQGVPPDPLHVQRGRGHRRPARRARPRGARGRPALPRPDRGVRAAVLRRHPHRGRRGRALRPAGAADPRGLPARRLGAARRVLELGAAADREGVREGEPGLRRAATCCSPRRSAHRPPAVGVLDGIGTVRARLRAMPAIAYAALWNVAGNPAASVPAGIGRRRAAARGAAGRPHATTRPTLLPLSGTAGGRPALAD